MSDELVRRQQQFWEGKIANHGPNYRGVDYGNPERQPLCFSQLTRIWTDKSVSADILDYGCEYGALILTICSAKVFPYGNSAVEIWLAVSPWGRAGTCRQT